MAVDGVGLPRDGIDVIDEAFLLRRDGRRFTGLSRLVGYITGARAVRRVNNFPVLISPQATPGDDGECVSTTTSVKIAPLLVVTGSLVLTGDDIAAAVRFPGHEGNPQTRRPAANAAMRETTPTPIRNGPVSNCDQL